MNNTLQHHGVVGMKWGVRRYQNKDGTLTDAGKKRYERDVRENMSKKKDNRIDTSQPDPNRWVKEDLQRSRNIIDSTSNLLRKTNEIEKKTRPAVDLSNMSDKELRDQINRWSLEKQYRNLLEDETVNVSKGKETVQSILDTCGTVLSIGSSAVALALAIKELKGG